jgi:GDSL-like Lipase/Acylhydrolase family
MLGLARPPRWGTVTILVLAVVNAALFTYLALRPAPVDPLAGRSAPSPAAQTSGVTPAAGTTSPATTSEAAPEPAPTPVLAVYGDGYSLGNELGGQGAAGWSALVADELEADLRLHAVSMAGFAALGTTGQDLPGIVEASPEPDATVTVVYGSRNDWGQTASAVAEGATETFSTIMATAPETELVVVGPAWSNADVPAELLVLRDAVRDAAEAAGADFVDPLADGWFSDPATLIAPDGISPTDAGHEFMAAEILPAVQQALADARSSDD